MHINANTKLIGNQVVLVPYEAAHVDKYHRWMEDEELREQTASERLSLEQEYEMQRSWREDNDKCTFIILSRTLLQQQNDELSSMIGDVNIFIYDGVGELEIMIAEREWRGRGIAKECILLMIRYAYDYLHINRFEAKISENNTISISLFKKLGFEPISYSDAFKEYTLVLDPSRIRSVINDVNLHIENYRSVSQSN